MKPSRELFATIVVLVCLMINVRTIKCDPDTTVDTYDCSADTFDPESGYGQEVQHGMDELTYYTCDKPQYQYILTGTYAVGFAYCQVNLTPVDCVTCLESASDFLKADCSDTVTAYVALIDCGMRYAPVNT